MAFALEEQMKFFFAHVLSGFVFRSAWAGLILVGTSSVLSAPAVHSCLGAGFLREDVLLWTEQEIAP